MALRGQVGTNKNSAGMVGGWKAVSCTVYAIYPSIGPPSFMLLPLLCLTPPAEGSPFDDLRKIVHGGQRMAKVHNDGEILPKVLTPWVGRTNVVIKFSI